MTGQRRRELLRRLGFAGLLGLAGCQRAPEVDHSQTITSTERPNEDTAGLVQTTTSHDAISVDAIETDRLVGAHYYPWYEMHAGHEEWTDHTPLDPILGEYAADDPTVIDQHLTWCLEHGVRWLSTSWWGPDSVTDTVLDETLPEADLFDHVKFSILYETLGRLGEFAYDMDTLAARNRLRADLAYLAETYFRKDNYLHLDERPVVFFYIAHRLQGDLASAFEAATRSLDTDPYVLAGLPFDTSPDNYLVTEVADAVTAYSPYLARPDIDTIFHDHYAHGNAVMQVGAAAADVGYVPVVMPGFNNTADSRSDDVPVLPASPSRYETVCDQVAPHLSESEAVLVTSFNEWYETTAIEPHAAHGDAYLELTAGRLATGSFPSYEVDGVTLRFAFNKTIVPAEATDDNPDTRALAFMADRIELFDGDATVRSYDVGTSASEPVYSKGAFGTEVADGNSWRWFGGHNAETSLLVEEPPPGIDSGVLRGQPMRSDEIEADVYYDGVLTDHLVFGERNGFDDYAFSLERET